jgi:hypothetical protein
MERHDEKGRLAGRPHSSGLATHRNSRPAILAAGRPPSTEIDRYTALELLKRGRLLVREYTAQGTRWSIIPGGFLVAGSIARQLLRFANLEPVDRGFWDGLEQSYRLR